MNTGLERACSKRREFGCVYKIALWQQRSAELHNCEALKYWGESSFGDLRGTDNILYESEDGLRK